MDVKKLNGVVEELKKTLGDALIATDIWTTADGQILACFNSQPKGAALFNQMVNRINDALKEAKFPLMRHYLLKHLEGDRIAMTILLGDYTWGVIIDTHKTQLGLFLNVILPETMDSIKQALAA